MEMKTDENRTEREAAGLNCITLATSKNNLIVTNSLDPL